MKTYLVRFSTGASAVVQARDEDHAHSLAQDAVPTTASGLVTEVPSCPSPGHASGLHIPEEFSGECGSCAAMVFHLA